MRVRLGIVLAAISLAVPGQAQVPAGGQFRVNGYATGFQGLPAIAADADGNFVVIWEDAYRIRNSIDLWGRWFTAAGVPRGDDFAVNAFTTGDQFQASVASDAHGNSVVVWDGYGDDPSSFGIFGRRFDPTGTPRGPDFRVNSSTTGAQRGASVAGDRQGNFVVVWQDPLPTGPIARGQLFDREGVPRGGEFQIGASTTLHQGYPSVAMDDAGGFVVAWPTYVQYSVRGGVFAQRFAADGGRLGGEFRVSTATTTDEIWPFVTMAPDRTFFVSWLGASIFNGRALTARHFDSAGLPLGPPVEGARVSTFSRQPPLVAPDAAGDFVMAWSAYDSYPPTMGVFAQRYDAAGAPRGAAFLVNAHTGLQQVVGSVHSDPVGNFIVTWSDFVPEDVLAQRYGGLSPAALAVDPAGNGVVEPGEAVAFRPSWRNTNGATQAFTGALSAFGGPAGATYTITDAGGDYGSVPDGTAAACTDCYGLAVSDPTTRPAPHWDASVLESLAPDAQGQRQRWAVHIGRSFSDVPPTNGFYRFVETLLHHGITTGCGPGSYCPASATSRDQMAVFVLTAKEGPGYAPPDCSPPNLFADVPETSPFCRWIEELARRGVVSGCGGSNYCPTTAVTRDQMAVFVLRTLDPALNPPACGTPMFNDVPASNAFCKWIEELARRGVVSGCGGGNYCPASPVTRDQMGVFLSATFGLTLYGP